MKSSHNICKCLQAAPENHCPRRLMGHSQGLLVSSPSLGLRPELPCSMTWCDSRKRERKERGRSRVDHLSKLTN